MRKERKNWKLQWALPIDGTRLWRYRIPHRGLVQFLIIFALSSSCALLPTPSFLRDTLSWRKVCEVLPIL